MNNIIINNNIPLKNVDNIHVYENNEYIGLYNYSESIFLNDSSNYIFIINEKVIDIIQDKGFLNYVFVNYGYLILGILIFIIILGFISFIFNKTKR